MKIQKARTFASFFILLLSVSAGRLIAQTITNQPPDQVVFIGQSLQLTVGVSGTGPFTYQWQFNGTNISNNINIISTVAPPFSGGNLNDPTGVAVSPSGILYIVEDAQSRIQAVSNGTMIQVAGLNFTGGCSFSGDNGPALNSGICQPGAIAFDSFGNYFFTDAGNQRIRKVDTNGIITTVAGNGTNGFAGDGGPAINAQFSGPYGIAIDESGNLFIADVGNNRIRKIDTNGIINTVAGNGSPGFFGDRNAATNAMLKSPTGVAMDQMGNMFIADLANNRIRKVDTNGIITTFAGTGAANFSGDNGAATNAALYYPVSVAVDAYEDVFIADQRNGRVRFVNANGIINTLTGNGNGGDTGDGGLASNAGLVSAQGLGLDQYGNLYIADNAKIREVDLGRNPSLLLTNVFPTNAGNYSVIITSATGSATSRVAAVTVVYPARIASQPSNINTTNGGSAHFSITGAGTGNLTYQWYFNTNAPVAVGTNADLLISPVTTNQLGNYFCIVSNTYGNATSRVVSVAFGIPPVSILLQSNITIISGSNTSFGIEVSGTGPFQYQWRINGTNLPNNIITTLAPTASFSAPFSLAPDLLGNVFVADTSHGLIKKISPDGSVVTYAGGGFHATGVATNSQLMFPFGVAVDAYGDVFGAISFQEVIKVDPSGILSVIADQPRRVGLSGDGGYAVNCFLTSPSGVAIDSGGSIFIADRGAGLVRKIDAGGIINTVAGNGTLISSGDGNAATNAGLNRPYAVAVDGQGNLFVTDTAASRIRKVDVNGLITTVAGNGTNGYSGDGGLATNANLNFPTGIAVGISGNLFVADTSNNCVRMVDSSGIITTVAGTGASGYSGDGGLATNALLARPNGVAADSSGNLFIADTQNNKIRQVAFGGMPSLSLTNLSASNAGSYTVVVTSPFGSVTNTGTLSVLTRPFATNIKNSYSSVTGAGITISFSGGANEPYLVQATTNMSPPIQWQTISTNYAGADGNWQFSDTNAASYPTRFYRAITP